MPQIDIQTALAEAPPWAQALIGIWLLAVAALVVNLVVKRVVLRLLRKLLDATEFFIEPAHLMPVVRRLSNVAPAVVVSRGIAAVPHLPEGAVAVTRNVASAFIVLTVVLAVAGALNLVNEVYSRRPMAASRPIKGYIQVAKILLYAGSAVLIVAALMERSPLLLLSGLGAMAAVLMLVFKDTILSLVASVQLSSNDMLRVGDWIEMPALDANGDVVDIALHTVKVQNWDKTITTIPTHRLVSESYKNWRAMFEAGGRRIERALFIDQTTIRFLEPKEADALKRFSVLRPWIEAKQAELDRWNAGLAGGADARRLTNIGALRAYVEAYLKSQARVLQSEFLMVRQLEPTPQGLPLQIYCFSASTAWADYEALQADIFDHLLAILPEFDLLLFQEPSGRDMKGLARAVETRAAKAA